MLTPCTCSLTEALSKGDVSSQIDYALILDIHAHHGHFKKLSDSTAVIAQAQRNADVGREFLVYRDFHFDQGLFKFVFPLRSFAELDPTPGNTFKVTKEVLGIAGEQTALQFRDSVNTIRSNIVRPHPRISNGRGGSETSASPFIRITKVKTTAVRDCAGAGRKALKALKSANRHFSAYKSLTGSLFSFNMVSRLESLGELDDRPTMRNIFRQSFGDEEGDQILFEHRRGVIDSTSTVLRYVPEISNYQ